jgi:hypothetical protein
MHNYQLVRRIRPRKMDFMCDVFSRVHLSNEKQLERQDRAMTPFSRLEAVDAHYVIKTMMRRFVIVFEPLLAMKYQRLLKQFIPDHSEGPSQLSDHSLT